MQTCRFLMDTNQLLGALAFAAAIGFGWGLSQMIVSALRSAVGR